MTPPQAPVVPQARSEVDVTGRGVTSVTQVHKAKNSGNARRVRVPPLFALIGLQIGPIFESLAFRRLEEEMDRMELSAT